MEDPFNTKMQAKVEDVPTMPVQQEFLSLKKEDLPEILELYENLIHADLELKRTNYSKIEKVSPPPADDAGWIDVRDLPPAPPYNENDDKSHLEGIARGF